MNPVKALWAGYAKHVNTIPKNSPPDDAETPKTDLRRHGWWKPVRIAIDHLYPMPWNPPESFPQSLATLESRLTTRSDAVARQLLAEAQRLFDEAEESVRSAERRATTLQGTVAIAVTVTVTGGALVLDPSTIHGGWRIAIGVGLAGIVALLVMTAFRALGATSRPMTYHTVSGRDILIRAQMVDPAQAKTSHAAELLYAYGRNAEVVQIKVWYLKKAAFWFRCALVVVVIVAGLICAYSFASPAAPCLCAHHRRSARSNNPGMAACGSDNACQRLSQSATDVRSTLHGDGRDRRPTTAGVRAGLRGSPAGG